MKVPTREEWEAYLRELREKHGRTSKCWSWKNW